MYVCMYTRVYATTRPLFIKLIRMGFF